MVQLLLVVITLVAASQTFAKLKSGKIHQKLSRPTFRLRPLMISSKVEINQTFLSTRISYDNALESLKQWKFSSAAAGISDSLENIMHVIDSDGDGIRAGVYLSERWFTTKSKAYHACKNGQVKLNGNLIYASKILLLNDKLEIEFAKPEDPVKINSKAEVIGLALDAASQLQKLVNFTSHVLDERRHPPLHILYEDNELAVVFKPSGLHSMKWIGTMKKQLFALDDVLPLILKPPEIIQSSGMSISDSLKRPLPCHRLDARVSGCVIVAKTQRAMSDLSKQFELRCIKKEYSAILAGNLTEVLLREFSESKKSLLTLIDSPEEANHPDIGGFFQFRRRGIITDLIDGYDAITELRLVDITPCSVYGALTTVTLYPLTGRRHQLRRHTAILGCPIVGDDLYHDAACLSITERLAGIQAVSVGKLKSEVGTKEETDENGKEEGRQGSYKENIDIFNETNDVRNKTIDISYNNFVAVTSDPIPLDSALKISTAPKVVRKGVGLFLVCTALDFYHPLKTVSGALPEDLSVKSTVGIRDIDNQLQLEMQVQQKSQQLCNVDDRHRIRVECKVGPKFAHLKEKAQKGHDWKAQSKARSPGIID